MLEALFQGKKGYKIIDEKTHYWGNLVQSPDDYASVRTVIENYIEGSFTADTALLKSCFHPKALVSGYHRGDLDVGSPRTFYD